MNKAEIIREVATAAGQSINVSGAVIGAFLATIQNELAKGGKVVLKDFGTFAIRERKERVGRNPRTGEEMTIPAQKLAHFKQAKNAKRTINA